MHLHVQCTWRLGSNTHRYLKCIYTCTHCSEWIFILGQPFSWEYINMRYFCPSQKWSTTEFSLHTAFICNTFTLQIVNNHQCKSITGKCSLTCIIDVMFFGPSLYKHHQGLDTIVHYNKITCFENCSSQTNCTWDK